MVKLSFPVISGKNNEKKPNPNLPMRIKISKPEDRQNQRSESKLWQLYIPLFLLLVLLFVIVFLPWLDKTNFKTNFKPQNLFLRKTKQNPCAPERFEIVESIPEGLIYPGYAAKHPSTFDTWKNLIKMAKKTIEIGSFYWTLKGWHEFPNESAQGDEIFNAILHAGINCKVDVRVAANKITASLSRNDTKILIKKKAAQVKYLDFDALIGSGVLHTKFMIIDRKHFYLGSANMDWRALNQVKELGIVVYNSTSAAEDLAKIFDAYWIAGNETCLPNQWPDSLSTTYNSKNPMTLTLDGHQTQAYITSSPPKFSSKGRNDDLAAVIQLINDAKKFIHISVMNYLPLIMFSKKMTYWSIIDNELRKAVVDRNVEVRLLTSRWPSTRPMEYNFLKSLLALNKFRKGAVFEVKQFVVPSNSTQSQIPFARVNHNKYMVTDNAAFIGTSNWSGDYFTSTAGVSFVSPSTNGTTNVIQKQLQEIFNRDWTSSYAKSICI